MSQTHPRHLLKELALAGITDMEAANRYLQEVYHAVEKLLQMVDCSNFSTAC